MIYYLIPSGMEPHEVSDNNIIGELSFNSFHTGIAWNVLTKLINGKKEKALKTISIIDSKNNKWEVDKFLIMLKDYHILKY